MYKTKFIIIGIIICLILFLYLIYRYEKDRHVKNIADEWMRKTNGGAIKIDDEGRYKDDYYLSINKFENYDSHIHLIVNNCGNYMCYIVKKYNLHSDVYFIDNTKNVSKLVDEMIYNLINFKD